MASSSPDDIDHEAEAAEILLRTWLDDDQACDLVGMLVEEAESVMNILYEQWPHRHHEIDECFRQQVTAFYRAITT